MGIGDVQFGDTYPYWNFIKPPQDLDIKPDGNFPTFYHDIIGLLEYGSLLTLSDSRASTTPGPLGNKYFLNSGGQCCKTTKGKPWGNMTTKNVLGSYSCDKEDLVDRYIFINNIPTGVLPFIDFEKPSKPGAVTGLMPGILEDVFKLPMEIGGFYRAMLEPSHPPCIEVDLHVIDSHNKTTVETHYVATRDLLLMPASDFPDHKNPITTLPSTEFFTNLNVQNTDNIYMKDPIISLYFILLIILAIYIFYRLFYTNRKR
jgi:hypothetical protein